MAEIILGPIIGGLSHKRVNLWARADKASTLYAWLGTKPDNGVVDVNFTNKKNPQVRFELNYERKGEVGGKIKSIQIINDIARQIRFPDWRPQKVANAKFAKRRVGGGYIFVHRLLMEHFAEMYVETPASKGNQKS